ncbi:MAG: PLP-dependent aminotransferase family protein [Propionibacteriaceae bacterium]|nr:PLP-dependent aminotransferase family protein [Propionibacteriaceae bacterium]
MTRKILAMGAAPGLISLAGGMPAPESFPVAQIKEAAGKVLTDTPAAALQYGVSDGYMPLREWVSQDLEKRGVHYAPDQILITNGSQQAISLAAWVFLEDGAKLAVETPTYLAAISTFRPTGCDFVDMPCDCDGPIPEELYKVADARFAYVIPNFQNPAGLLISAKRRRAIAEAASELGLPIFEDNPYGDLYYDNEPPAPLAAVDPENTIYGGSFSKVLSPGMRVGYVACPKPVYKYFLNLKSAIDVHTNMLNQMIVHEVVKDGFLDNHLESVRSRYKVHRDAMAQALTKYMPKEAAWQTPSGGMFFWVTFPEGTDCTSLLDEAVKRGVAYVPGEAFYAIDPPTNSLRLSFVTVSVEQIDAGVKMLAELLS